MKRGNFVAELSTNWFQVFQRRRHALSQGNAAAIYRETFGITLVSVVALAKWRFINLFDLVCS